MVVGKSQIGITSCVSLELSTRSRLSAQQQYHVADSRLTETELKEALFHGSYK